MPIKTDVLKKNQIRNSFDLDKLRRQKKLKQEAHRPHCSPEKTVQIDKHILILIEIRQNSLLTLRELNGFSF